MDTIFNTPHLSCWYLLPDPSVHLQPCPPNMHVPAQRSSMFVPILTILHTDPHPTRPDGQTLPSLVLLHHGPCPATPSRWALPNLELFHHSPCPDRTGGCTHSTQGMHLEYVVLVASGLAFLGPTKLKQSGRELLASYQPQSTGQTID